ncbi:MAG: hypothetical protein ACK56I_08455, partial [bacterium]
MRTSLVRKTHGLGLDTIRGRGGQRSHVSDKTVMGYMPLTHFVINHVLRLGDSRVVIGSRRQIIRE